MTEKGEAFLKSFGIGKRMAKIVNVPKADILNESIKPDVSS